jgi:hypothetical protein
MQALFSSAEGGMIAVLALAAAFAAFIALFATAKKPLLRALALLPQPLLLVLLIRAAASIFELPRDAAALAVIAAAATAIYATEVTLFFAALRSKGGGVELENAFIPPRKEGGGCAR